MGKQAVNDHGVEEDDNHGAADGDDAGHGDSNALMSSERVVESVIIQGEWLVERFDFVNDDEEGTKTNDDKIIADVGEDYSLG